MILLFTDFGETGPYLGQMTARLRVCGYSGDVINLFSDAPAFSVKASACLLATFYAEFPKESLFLSVVDPGVGSERKALVIRSHDRWFVGPDNGIFELLIRHDKGAKAWEIVWKPEKLSTSFHGRDIFAPIAADILNNKTDDKLAPLDIAKVKRFNWPDNLAEIVYIDHYGNAMTGIRAAEGIKSISLKGETLEISNTFSSAAKGTPLAYENANGLIEIAVNQGRADTFFDLRIGSQVAFLKA